MVAERSIRFVVALVLGFGATAHAERLAPGDSEIAVEHGGRERVALVHIPPAAAQGQPLPVVFAFHGGGGNAEQHREWLGLDAVADREGFIAVYPFGSGRLFDRKLLTWNAGSCCAYAAKERVDDVGATVALLEALARRTPVDATRVYATGMSNGAMMALRLAHDAGARFAAIATVAGVAVFRPFTAKTPMPILHIHSADDPRAPYDGGTGPRQPGGTRIEHPPVAVALDDWVALNGCPMHPLAQQTITAKPDSPDAGQTATQFRYAPCASDADIELWKLTGAGHVWPGAKPHYERLLGTPTSLIDANDVAWKFLSRFRRTNAPALPAPAP